MFSRLSRYTAVLIIFFLVGVFLRWYNFADFPVFGETRDEVAWTMQGASLIQTGIPQSWSYFASYENAREVILAGASYRLVTPSVDHPPLFGLIPGFFSTVQGAAWDEMPSVVAFRLPQIAISVFNLGLFIGVARRWFGESVAGLVAVGSFALTPSWIFLQRLAVSETLLLTWILLLLLAVTWSKSSRWTWAGAVALVALPLTKVSGLAVVAGGIVAQWSLPVTQRFRNWLGAGVVGILSVLAYFSWVDWSLFLSVQSEQAQRDTGFLTFFSTQVWSESLVVQAFADPWITLGFFVCLGVICVSDPKKLGLKVDQTAWNTFRAIFLAQLAFLLISVGETTVHGWYKIVFFPFFALGFGMLGEWLWKTRSLFGLAVVGILLSLVVRQGLWYLLGTDLYELQSGLSKFWLSFCGIFVVAEFMLHETWKQRVFKIGSLVLFGIVVLSSISTVVNLTQEKYWQDASYLETGLRS